MESSVHAADAARFTSTTYAMAIGKVETSEAIGESARARWRRTIVQNVLEGNDPEEYRLFFERTRMVGSQLDIDVPSEYLDYLRNTVGFFDPATEGGDDVTPETASKFVAAGLLELWQETFLDGTHFETVVEAVDALEDTASEAHATLVERVLKHVKDIEGGAHVAALDWQDVFE